MAWLTEILIYLCIKTDSLLFSLNIFVQNRKIEIIHYDVSETHIDFL